MLLRGDRKIWTCHTPLPYITKIPQNSIRAELHAKICPKNCSRHLREALRQRQCGRSPRPYARLKIGRPQRPSVRPTV